MEKFTMPFAPKEEETKKRTNTRKTPREDAKDGDNNNNNNKPSDRTHMGDFESSGGASWASRQQQQQEEGRVLFGSQDRLPQRHALSRHWPRRTNNYPRFADFSSAPHITKEEEEKELNSLSAQEKAEIANDLKPSLLRAPRQRRQRQEQAAKELGTDSTDDPSSESQHHHIDNEDEADQEVNPSTTAISSASLDDDDKREDEDHHGSFASAQEALHALDEEMSRRQHHDQAVDGEEQSCSSPQVGLQQQQKSSALQQALEECPDFVRSSHYKMMFLQWSNFNVERAVSRMECYWQDRIQVFGAARAFLPLQDAMGNEGAAALAKGFIQNLGTCDVYGRPLLFLDASKHDHTVFPREGMHRAAWFVLHRAAENLATQRHGGFVGLLTNEASSSFQFDGKLYRRMAHSLCNCLPLCAKALHLCYPHRYTHFLLPVVKHLLGRHLRLRFRIHRGTRDQVLEELQTRYGILPHAIPQVLGGNVNVDVMNRQLFLVMPQRRRRRRRQEEEEEEEEEEVGDYDRQNQWNKEEMDS